MQAKGELLRRFWERIEARAWDEAQACLADDLLVDWPHTGERFQGAERFIAMQRAYPEGWSIRVLRVVANGDQVVSEIAVEHGVETFFAATFATVRNGRIIRATEYWVTAGGEEAPAWRERYRTR